MKEKNLKDMILLPLTDDNELGADLHDVALKLASTDYYPVLFTKAYGSALINEERIIDALVQFIGSMNTFNSRFDKQSSDLFRDFTDEEIVGLEIFSFACTACHSQGKHTLFGGIDVIFTDDILDVFPFIFNNGLPHDPDDAGTCHGHGDRTALSFPHY